MTQPPRNPLQFAAEAASALGYSEASADAMQRDAESDMLQRMTQQPEMLLAELYGYAESLLQAILPAAIAQMSTKLLNQAHRTMELMRKLLKWHLDAAAQKRDMELKTQAEVARIEARAQAQARSSASAKANAHLSPTTPTPIDGEALLAEMYRELEALERHEALLEQQYQEEQAQLQPQHNLQPSDVTPGRTTSPG